MEKALRSLVALITPKVNVTHPTSDLNYHVRGILLDGGEEVEATIEGITHLIFSRIKNCPFHEKLNLEINRVVEEVLK